MRVASFGHYIAPQRIAKRKSAEQKRIERLVARMEGRIKRAFLDFVRVVKSPQVLREVAERLGRSDVVGALAIVDSHMARLGPVIAEAFIAAGVTEVDALQEQVRRLAPAIGLAFDPGDSRAAALMRENRLRLISEMTDQQRRAIRQALIDGLERGLGPRDMARAFRDAIGLTARQEAAVRNYRRLLELGSTEALERDIRDRRFDPTVARAARTGEPLSPAQIDRMVGRYRQRYLAYRAEVIGRTEAAAAVNAAREEALRQVTRDAGIEDTLIEREWRAVMDSRTRHSHAAMNGQVQPGTEQAFTAPSGATLRFPGDPLAPAAEVVNCRCVVVNRVKRPEREAA